jgi:hypothetical protein
MTSREPLTIDSTVTYDMHFKTALRHEFALELFELFRSGEVELSSAPLGHRLDSDDSPHLAVELRTLLETEGVPELGQLSYPTTATYPGEDFFPGQYVHGFCEAWEAELDRWRPHLDRKPPGTNDWIHIETHIFERRDAFITDDGALLRICSRLCRHGFRVVAMGLEEYLAARPLTRR